MRLLFFVFSIFDVISFVFLYFNVTLFTFSIFNVIFIMFSIFNASLNFFMLFFILMISCISISFYFVVKSTTMEFIYWRIVNSRNIKFEIWNLKLNFENVVVWKHCLRKKNHDSKFEFEFRKCRIKTLFKKKNHEFSMNRSQYLAKSHYFYILFFILSWYQICIFEIWQLIYVNVNIKIWIQMRLKWVENKNQDVVN